MPSNDEIGAVNLITLDLIYSGLSKIPAMGEEVFTDRFSFSLGGGPPSSLIIAARLGAKTRLATSLGEDHISGIAKSFLEGEPIHYKSFYRETGKIPVNITSVISIKNQDRTFVSYFFDSDFCDAFIDGIYEYLKGVSFCFVTTPCDGLLRRLKEGGCRIIYDVGWSDDLSLASLKQTLEYVYLFAPNEKEALKLTGAGSVGKALEILAAYVPVPIIKLGKQGALVWKDGRAERVPAWDFEALDATGAGDAFLGGVTYGLLQGWDIIRCVELGNYTGGKATTTPGCVTAQFSLEEFQAGGRGK